MQIVPRRTLLAQGIGGALLAALLLVAGLAGSAALLAAVAVVQVLLLLGFLALVEAPAAAGIFVVALGATVAADVVVALQDGRVGGLAGVAALSLVAGLLHQLSRKDRSRVTESLADTLVIVVLVCGAACLVATRQVAGGRGAVTVALVAAGAALLAGRVGDAVARRPALVVGTTRGWLGFVLALAVGAAAGAAAGGDRMTGTQAALLGLAVATIVIATDLAVDVAAGALRTSAQHTRRVAALRPVGLLLPVAALGPVAWVAARLVLGAP